MIRSNPTPKATRRIAQPRGNSVADPIPALAIPARPEWNLDMVANLAIDHAERVIAEGEAAGYYYGSIESVAYQTYRAVTRALDNAPGTPRREQRPGAITHERLTERLSGENTFADVLHERGH